jgi:Coenzyme PQQ synthesis protein D (PqqD)
MMSEPQTVSEICARLIAEYDVPPEVCEAEILAFFLAQMAEQRIIDVVAN